MEPAERELSLRTRIGPFHRPPYCPSGNRSGQILIYRERKIELDKIPSSIFHMEYIFYQHIKVL